jgi:chemotaxis protein MotB
MARRPKRHEDHTNHEAWAIPYGDLITLLLAFFVVMYALSSVNEGKYRVLSDSLYAAFRGTPRTLEPVQVGEKQVGSGADIRTSIVQQDVLQGQPRQLLMPLPMKLPLETIKIATTAHSAELAKQATTADESLAHVASEVERAMAEQVKNNVVVVRRSDLWIEVEIRTDILFTSGRAQLSPTAVAVLQQLAGVLAPLPNGVRVEGHTDNVPIRTASFYSNWELSAARAGSVVRVLSGAGVAPNRLAVVGFGDQHPLQSNDTAQGRNANRRVVVVILSADPAHRNDPLQMMPATGPTQAEPAPPQAPDTGAPAPATNPPAGGSTATPPAAAAAPAGSSAAPSLAAGTRPAAAATPPPGVASAPNGAAALP